MSDNEYYEFDYDALKTKADQLYSDVCKGTLSYLEEEELEEIIEFWLEEDEANKAYEIAEAALILHPNHPVFYCRRQIRLSSSIGWRKRKTYWTITFSLIELMPITLFFNQKFSSS